MDPNFTKERVEEIERMNKHQLMFTAGNEELASVVEASFRLKRSTEYLTWVLIVLTAVTAVLTAAIAYDPVKQIFKRFFN